MEKRLFLIKLLFSTSLQTSVDLYLSSDNSCVLFHTIHRLFRNIIPDNICFLFPPKKLQFLILHKVVAVFLKQKLFFIPSQIVILFFLSGLSETSGKLKKNV